MYVVEERPNQKHTKNNVYFKFLKIIDEFITFNQKPHKLTHYPPFLIKLRITKI